MGPEMSVLAASVALLSEIGGWPLVTILLFFAVAPVILLIYVIRNLVVAVVSLRDEVRIEITASQQHYDNNVELVKNYDSLASELTTMVRVSTAASTQLAELISHFLKTRNK